MLQKAAQAGQQPAEAPPTGAAVTAQSQEGGGGHSCPACLHQTTCPQFFLNKAMRFPTPPGDGCWVSLRKTEESSRLEAEAVLLLVIPLWCQTKKKSRPQQRKPCRRCILSARAPASVRLSEVAPPRSSLQEPMQAALAAL